MKWLIVDPSTSFDDALAMSTANDCVGWYSGVPPVWQGMSADQGWTLPCTVTQDAEGDVTGWAPV